MFEYYDDQEIIEETSAVFKEYKRGKNDAHVMYLSHLYLEIKNRRLSNKLERYIEMGLESLVTKKDEIVEVVATTSSSGSTSTEKRTRASRQSGDASNPLTGLQNWIEQVAKAGVDENKVREIIKAELSTIPPRRIEIKVGDNVTKFSGKTHFYFELVLKCIGAGVNLALSGSTATSKTTMAIQSAKALGRNYYIQPMNDGTTKSDIMGYMSASGEYIKSSFYRAMTEGAYYIAEEIDSGSPACLLVLNNAVDNRECTFPNGETVKAKDGFQVICTMNTKGTGSDRKFVGRNRLDAATLDRFCLVDVPVDTSLEASLLGITETIEPLNIAQGGIASADKWLSVVRKHRADYARSHPDKIVSMRATRDGWKLIQAGIGLDHVVNICINK
jgi:cobaltochelatase CobS